MTRENVCILGITRSGKTELAMKRYLESDLSIVIFFNSKHERKPRKISDVVVKSVKEFDRVLELIWKKKMRRIFSTVHICFDPAEKPSEAAIQLKMIVSILLKIGRQIQAKRIETRYWCALFIDEFHRYSDKKAPSETIDLLFTEGLGLGIIGTAISQRPALVSHTILAECEIHFYFYFGNFEWDYFKRHKLDIESNMQWLRKKYHFLYKNRDGVQKVRPIEPVVK